MTPELPKRTVQSPENPLGRFEGRFRSLENEIMTSLKSPTDYLVISKSRQDMDIKEGAVFTLGKTGNWSLHMGDVSSKQITDSNKFLGVLKEHAFVINYDELFQPLHDDLREKKLTAEGFSLKYSMARQSLDRSIEENPVPFAELLLEHMEQALQRYRNSLY